MTSAPAFSIDLPVDVEFHRLARTRPRYRWWRGLVTGVVGIGLYLAVLALVFVALVIVALSAPAGDEAITSFAALAEAESFDLDRPWLLAVLLIPLILMIPVLLAASRMIEGRGTGFLISVTGRMRWGWLGHTMLLAMIVFLASFALWIAVDTALGVPFELRLDHPGIPTMLVLVVLLVPFQAAAEEYVFRGYLMQLVGGWLRHPAFAILLPAPLFVLGHGYDIWGGLTVGAVAVVAGWLCWRTGGLEAAISMHVANNVTIFLFASVGLIDGNAAEGTPVDVIVQTAILLVYALLVVRSAERRGIQRRGGGIVRRSGQAASSSASMMV